MIDLIVLPVFASTHGFLTQCKQSLDFALTGKRLFVNILPFYFNSKDSQEAFSVVFFLKIGFNLELDISFPV